MKFKSQFFIVLMLFTNNLFGQSTLDLYKTKYPQTESIFLSYTTYIKIFKEKGVVKIISKHNESVMPLTENGVMDNNKSISTSSFVEVTDVKASVMVPNKSSYKNVKVTEINLKDDMNENSFYDDTKSYNFLFASMTVGCKTMLEYTTTFNDPRFFGSYFFGNYLDVDSSDITVEVAKGIDLCFTEFNFEGIKIDFTKKESSKSIIYKWKSIRVPKIQIEKNCPNPRYYIPHIIFRICGYDDNGTYKYVLKSTQDLYNWYAELTKSTNIGTSNELKKITDSLIVGATTDQEKVSRIFYWVQDKIAYVAIEDGLGGYVPRDASLVFSRRYGDCKDMASIITNMIKYAGLDAYLTWIGTRDIPYTYNEVPTPHNDNHMIATWKDENGKPYFLDATGKFHPFGFPTEMIQGKEALLGINAEKYEIIKVEEVPSLKNTSHDILDVYVDGDGIKGEGIITLKGFEKSQFKAYAEHYNYAERIDFLKKVFPKGNNKLMIDTLILTDNGKEDPITILYKFRVPGYSKINQNEMYINLNLNKSFTGGIINLDRKVDVELDHKYIHSSTLNFHMPKEYKIESTPTNKEKKELNYNFKITTEIKDDVIIVKNEFELTCLLLKKKDFPLWNEFVKSYISSASETIVLKKIK